MRVEGVQSFPASPPERVFALLLDRESLAKCTPGLKSIEDEGDGRYRVVIEVGVAAVRGRYEGSLRTEDVRAPEHYRLVVDVSGTTGFVQANVDLDLTPDGEGSRLTYSGDAQVGGPVAGVGQRVLGGVAKLIVGQFFTAMAREVRRQEAKVE
jgi:carbon monoxide dehydrogenase subunit G